MLNINSHTVTLFQLLLTLFMFSAAASQCELFSLIMIQWVLISVVLRSSLSLLLSLKSTAHAFHILNTHQSHCHQKYIELCEQQCIEKMKSETSLNSEEEYETAVD